jgi:hypothetical protein
MCRLEAPLQPTFRPCVSTWTTLVTLQYVMQVVNTHVSTSCDAFGTKFERPCGVVACGLNTKRETVMVSDTPSNCKASRSKKEKGREKGKTQAKGKPESNPKKQKNKNKTEKTKKNKKKGKREKRSLCRGSNARPYVY